MIAFIKDFTVEPLTQLRHGNILQSTDYDYIFPGRSTPIVAM